MIAIFTSKIIAEGWGGIWRYCNQMHVYTSDNQGYHLYLLIELREYLMIKVVGIMIQLPPVITVELTKLQK